MSDDMTHRLAALTRVIEDVLVASHGMIADFHRYHENRGMSPAPYENKQGDLSETERLETANVVALKTYGPSPAFNIWCAVRSLEALRAVWTGQPMRAPPDPSLTTAPVEAPP